MAGDDDRGLIERIGEGAVPGTAIGAIVGSARAYLNAQGLAEASATAIAAAQAAPVPPTKSALRALRPKPLPGIVMTTATFAAVGGIFTGATAVAEDVRGKQDIWNGAIAGIAAGSVVGLRSGSLYASAGACGAFAAMSIILEILGGTMGPVEDRNAERRADLYR